MTILKCLNNLMLIENILGIYRSYASQKKIKKCFIIFQILLQTMLHTIAVIVEVYILLAEGDYDQSKLIRGCFAVLTCINSSAFVITSTCYSSAFQSFYKSICHVSEWFDGDKKLNNTIKKIYGFGITMMIFWIVNLAYRSTEVAKNFPHTKEHIFVPILISQTILRITVVFQHLILYIVVMTVVYLFKCLISLISVVQERLGICDIISNEQCNITREQIDEWVELYRDLANCCEKVTLCFGSQFYFSLIMSIVHFVLLTHQMFYLSYLNEGDSSAAKKIVSVIILYTITMMLPVVTGQLIRNQGIKIHRVLAKLYNIVIIIESNATEAKLIKDFMRLIKKNPLEIKLLSKIPAGMYMLPFIFMLAVNYVIVLLQFNNIV